MGILRRALQITLLVVTLVIGVTAAAVIVSQTVWFRDWLRGFIVRQGDQYLNGRLTIGHLGGNIFFGIELEDVAVTRNGEPVITIKDAGIAYSALQLLTRNIVITSLRLDQPIIHMRREDGVWDLSDLVRKRASEAQRKGPGLPVRLQDIVITGGSFVFDDRPVGTSGVDVPRALNKLDARLSFAYAPVHYTVDISHLTFRGQSPPFGLDALSGKVAVTGSSLYLENVALRTAASDLRIDGTVYNYAKAPSLDLSAASDKFDLNEIARIVPSLRSLDLQPAFRVTAKGPLNNLDVDLSMRSPSAGDVSGRLAVDVEAPQRRIGGTLHVRDLDVGALVRKPADRTDITGVMQFDMRLLNTRRANELPLTLTYTARADQVAALGYTARNVNAKGRVAGNRVDLDATALAYGGRGSAAGTITLPTGRAPIAYNLKGAVAGADLRQLPRSLKIPRVSSRLDLDYHIDGAGSNVKGDALLRPSTLAGATIGDGTRATFSYVGRHLAYGADGTVANLDLQRVGQQFGIVTLQQDRYKSNVTGRFNLSGSGTSLAAMRLDASGTLANSTMFGMTVPQLTFQTTLANRTLQAKANGQFRNLNPQTLSGAPGAKGNLAGSADMNVGLANLGAPSGTTSLLDDLSLNGQVSLQPSTLAGVRIDKGTFDGTYANRSGDIRQLSLSGPDVQLEVSGPVTFTDRGQSNLSYELMTPSLDRVARLVNEPLRGAVTVNGRLTGNAADLRATGTLKAANIAYGGADALNLTTQYDVTLPNLDSSRAILGATTTATFLKVAGQTFNQVVAKTSYANSTVAFDTQIRQPQRSLDAAGNVLLHPEHQEVHIRRLGLQSAGSSWQMAPGTQPVVEYRNSTIGVRNLRLVSDNQEIAAEGTIGPTASNLRARISNFNLVNVDALMLTNRQMGGVLNAEATITGPRDGLNVAGQFSVAGGSFRQFKYQSLAGKVDFAKSVIALDVRLQENPEAWLSATGSIPTALFAAAPSGPAANAPVDLRVQSSALDLGLVQGFTTAVQNATGTAQLGLTVGGTAANPTTNGAFDIRNGAFKVMSTGVSYSNVNSHVALQPDRVSIQSFSVSDNHGATLTMSGDLALRERQLGGVNVKVKSTDFKVVDNELGNVRLNTNISVAGEVRAPRISGTLAVNTGTVNIDKVLDLTSSAYSTSAEAVPTTEGGQPASQPIGQPVNEPASAAAQAPKLPGPPAAHAAAPAPAPSGSPYAASTIDLHFTAPDDLIIKGNDIRVGQSSVGMGNVNVTLGGDVRISKHPGGPIQLLGQVQTVRGTYDFQGRRFDIQRGGTVKLEGTQPPNPALDLTATRLITGVETRVHVGGSVRRPQLTLTSNPPLDQADILSLIVFGQPSNQLGEGQQVSLAQRASTIATGFVAGKLAQSIGNALNLSTFEIQTGTDTGETGATVTVGEQVGQRLYVKLRQGVGADNTSEFVLDYQLTDFMRFESTMSQGGTPTRNIMQRVQQSGADLIFLFSF